MELMKRYECLKENDDLRGMVELAFNKKEMEALRDYAMDEFDTS